MTNTAWRGLAAGAAAMLLALWTLAAGAAERPHIVYILADDLGWADVGFHGSRIETPHLDRIAASGAVLNAFYVQPFSSQTRAALMTGRYPMRYGLQTLSLMPASQYGLPVEERTLAQALKERGYGTAFVGAWKLGHAKPELWPTRRGFDSFYGSLSGQVEPLLKRNSKADWRRQEKPLKEEGYVTGLIAREAARLIGKHERATPMLLVLSFTAPARYHDAPRALLDKYRALPDDATRSYAAAVTALDSAVGDVVAALQKRDMLDDTLLVFHSDNGGALPTRYPTGDEDVNELAADNGVFREGRGSLYEGGVRAVALAAWPGKIRPKTVVTDMLHVTDVHATLLRLAGVSAPPPKPLDGMDIWPVLANSWRTPRKEMLLNVEDLRGALRVGEWKLIVHSALPSRIELFDIANDPEEVENKAATYPERVREMLRKLNDYAYDMEASKHLEEIAGTRPGQTPMFWRHNPVRR